MNNRDFNNAIVALAAQRMTEQGYATSEDAALEWLNLRSDHGSEPTFTPENSSFAARGAAKTLGRLCIHAWNVLRWRVDLVKKLTYPRRSKLTTRPFLK